MARKLQSGAGMTAQQSTFDHTLLAILVGTSLLAAGCPPEEPVDGERADGDCPEGEECSDRTPHGLQFIAPESPEFPRPAVGGLITFAIASYDEDGRPEDLAEPFDAAMCRAPGDCGDGFRVVEVDPPEVVVEVAADACEGEADERCGRYLRILEPGTERLLDRYWVMAARPEFVAVEPTGASDARGWSVLADAEVSMRIFLSPSSEVGGSTYSLVDESVSVAEPDGAEVTQDTWKSFELRAHEPGEVALEVHTGAESHAFTIPVVGEASAILPPRELPSSMEIGEEARVCFEAIDSDERQVLGLTWSLATDAPAIQIRRPEDRDDCAYFNAEEEGTAVVTISVAGESIERTVEVTARDEAA